MNKSWFLFYLCFSLILTACNGGEVVSETETLPPPVDVPQVTEAPQEIPATATPTLESIGQPIDFSNLKAGTSMFWYDQNELVFVPSGNFIMGGQEDIPERTVSQSGFWIYRYPVTNEMYQQCVTVGKCEAPASEPPYPDISDMDLKDYPVVGVTWEQAQNYCNWMNLRLPTEAEWEKAARGEDGNLYPWGDAEPTCDLSNYKGCQGKTSRVPDYPDGASPYGLMDMAGNVFEWVGDWYSEDFTQLETQDPQGPDTGTAKVIRSSSYKSGKNLLPSADRFSLEPDKYREDLGFRCATQEPQGFAPYCQVAGISGVNSPACEAPPDAELKVEHYCADRGTNLGGVRVTTDPDRETSVNFTPGSGETACFYTGDGHSDFYCVGPENSEVSVHYLTFCDLPAGLEGSVDPICPSGYEPFALSCRFTGDVSPTSTSELRCPSGYGFDSEAERCVTFGVGELGCPAGFSLDASQGCCAPSDTGSDGELIASVAASCPPHYSLFPVSMDEVYCLYNYEMSYSETTITLGDCADRAPSDDGGGDGGNSGICPPGQHLVCNNQVYPPVCTCQ